MADSLVVKDKYIPNWVKYIRQRVAKNKNFVTFISGPTGSGKSWASLAIAEMVDPDFSIERVVFSGAELMKLINSGKVDSGSVIVFEEAGIAMNNRAWQSAMNQMLNFLFQTFRHRNFVLILNSPYTDFLDAATRKLLHAEFQTVSIDKNKGTCKLKPHLIQYNSRLRKFYYKRLRVATPEGVTPIGFWNVPKPSQALLKEYEPKKRVFTDELNAKISKTFEEFEKSTSGKDELTDKQREVLHLLDTGLLVDDIARELDLNDKVVYDHMKRIKNKGYTITPVKIGKKVVKYDVS